MCDTKDEFAEGVRAHQEIDETEPREETKAPSPGAPQVADEDESNLEGKRRIEKVSRAIESEPEAVRPCLGHVVGRQ